jgi:TonB family protein
LGWIYAHEQGVYQARFSAGLQLRPQALASKLLESPFDSPGGQMRRSLSLLLASLLSSTIMASAEDTRTDADTAIYPMCNAVARSTRDKVFRVGQGIEPPRIIAQVHPKYSELAKHMRLEGTSRLTLAVDKEGFPVGICIARTLFPDLDQNAARAVSHWRFSPATKDGEPVYILVNVDVAFHLYTSESSSAPDPKEDPVPQPH